VVDRIGGRVYVNDWTQQHANVFRSIQLTKPILFIMLSLVIAVAAFNIVSTLFMVVREKRGDVAILRSFGATPRAVLALYSAQGTAIGVIGTIAGLILGLFLVAYLGSIVGLIEAWFGIDLLSADAYLIGDLATEARLGEVIRICLLSLSLAILATIYPAVMGSRQPPAEALRYE
jgi:lipoprotein-releasing system permease protein